MSHSKNSSTPTSANLDELIGLFYDSTDDLGKFESTEEDDIPLAYRELLAHNEHMTVTVEKWHQSAVDVHVLELSVDGPMYARRILLQRQSDGVVVQFGIVRLNLAYLDSGTRQEIEAHKKPLGRVLIERNVLRKVEMVGLWRIEPSPGLATELEMSDQASTYGRTALIYCNGEPAVELLEIVAPVV